MFSPQTGITFRSALDVLMRQNVFPVIQDPDLSTGSPGDVSRRSHCSGSPATSCGRDSDCPAGQTCFSEVNAVKRECDQAWTNILGGTSLPGVAVINARHLLDCSNCAGFGTGVWLGGPFNSHSSFRPEGGHVLLQDRKFAFSADADAHIVAHELGHVLALWHTDPPENLMNRVGGIGFQLVRNIQDAVDWCGSMPTPCDLSGFAGFTGMAPRTIDQIDWAQQEAPKWPAQVVDPAGTLFAGPVQASQQVDELRDVPVGEAFVDLDGVRIAGDQTNDVTRFTFQVLDDVPFPARVNYWLLADLDQDSTTGGQPATFPSGVPSTSFGGVEVIGLISIGVSNEFQSIGGRLFHFEGGQFVEITPQAPAFIRVLVEHLGRDLHDEPPAVDPTVRNVSLEFSTDLIPGGVGNQFRVQAFAQNLGTGTVDRLDNSDLGRGFSLVPPRFPECTTTPRVQPGGTVTAEASGLPSGQMAKVLLGDQMVATPTIAGDGSVQAKFVLAQDASAGLHLVTVGAVGTGLTADCGLTVVSGPVVCGDGVLGPGEQCDDGNTLNGDGCSSTCQLENEPPDCSGAVATSSTLWPPNHTLQSVSVQGVTDPDGDPVGVTITGISQDEPLLGSGTGNTCPDASGVGTPTAQLRAERGGLITADGRVYHVSFTAEDGRGGQCTGTVSVCVPYDQLPGPGHLVCIDEGPLVNSTGPCP